MAPEPLAKPKRAPRKPRAPISDAPVSEYDESEIEASRAPLMDHLVELRSRLIICALALAVGFGICFAFANHIIQFLLEPFNRAAGLEALQKAGGSHGPFDMLLALVGLKSFPHPQGDAIHMVFTAPLEFFFTKVKMAGFGAIVLTFPVLAFQLYRFVAPGLYKRERNAFLPFLSASPVLFLMGAALVLFHHAAVCSVVLAEPTDHGRRQRDFGGSCCPRCRSTWI